MRAKSTPNYIVSPDYVTMEYVGGAIETAPRILIGGEGSPCVGVYRHPEDAVASEERPEGRYDALVAWSSLTPEQAAAARANAAMEGDDVVAGD